MAPPEGKVTKSALFLDKLDKLNDAAWLSGTRYATVDLVSTDERRQTGKLSTVAYQSVDCLNSYRWR